jgi:hypothetical protein
MTRKTTKHSNPTEKKSKRITLSKQTLKDLGVPGQGPKGGRPIPCGKKTVPFSGCSF